jgi:hypothetical protein
VVGAAAHAPAGDGVAVKLEKPEAALDAGAAGEVAAPKPVVKEESESESESESEVNPWLGGVVNVKAGQLRLRCPRDALARSSKVLAAMVGALPPKEEGEAELELRGLEPLRLIDVVRLAVSGQAPKFELSGSDERLHAARGLRDPITDGPLGRPTDGALGVLVVSHQLGARKVRRACVAALGAGLSRSRSAATSMCVDVAVAVGGLCDDPEATPAGSRRRGAVPTGGGLKNADLAQLWKAATVAVGRNLGAVSRMPNFLDLSLSQVLLALVDPLEEAAEAACFDAAARWASHGESLASTGHRARGLPRLLEHIGLDKFSTAFIQDTVQPHATVQRSQECRRLLKTTLRSREPKEPGPAQRKAKVRTTPSWPRRWANSSLF